MDAENIFGMVIFLIVAGIMILIGIVQIRSKKPVGFYSGEKPPEADQLKDVKAWNHKHGYMWVLYGISIILFYFVGLWMGDTVFSVIPMYGGVVLPILAMIAYHKKLVIMYVIK